MRRILHLLGIEADEQSRQLHQMLVAGIGANFISETRRIGNGGDYRNLPAAVLKLRQQQKTIIYAWGTTALAAAVIARCPRIIFSPVGFAGKKSMRWIRPLMERSNVTMVCPTFTQQRLAVTSGINPDQCKVIQPGVDFGSVRPRRDSSLRKALGLGEDDFVLLAAGESTLQTGHEQAVWTAGILHQMNPSYKLILWGRGQRAAAIAASSRRLKMHNVVFIAESNLGRCVLFEDLLGVADAGLITAGTACPTLPVAMMMASGLPIVSTVTYMLAELLEDRHTALMVPKRSPRALVQRILDLRADPSLLHKLRDTARAEAYEHFSMTRMLDAYRRLLSPDKELIPADQRFTSEFAQT